LKDIFFCPDFCKITRLEKSGYFFVLRETRFVKPFVFKVTCYLCYLKKVTFNRHFLGAPKFEIQRQAQADSFINLAQVLQIFYTRHLSQNSIYAQVINNTTHLSTIYSDVIHIRCKTGHEFENPLKDIYKP